MQYYSQPFYVQKQVKDLVLFRSKLRLCQEFIPIIGNPLAGVRVQMEERLFGQ